MLQLEALTVDDVQVLAFIEFDCVRVQFSHELCLDIHQMKVWFLY